MNMQSNNRIFLWIEQLFQDIRFALRTQRKAPGFTVAVVLTLALGIGANTVAFSVVNALMFRELPFQEPDQLVMLWESNPKFGFDISTTSGPNFLDWRKQNRVFQEMGAMTIGHGDLFTKGEAMPLGILSVSPGFLSALGIQPAAGRFFAPDEEQPGKDQVVVLSYSLWKNRFNESRDIIGETVTLDGQPRTVIGVMPPGQNFLDNYGEAYIPLTTTILQQQRGNHHYFVIARMKPDVDIKKAQAEMATIAARLEKQYPDTNKDYGVLVKSMTDELTSFTSPYILGLAGIAMFVLLIVCVNTANLFMGRSILRNKEMAVRLALGGNRFRIVRQVLTESVLLAVAGGVVGFLISSSGIALINCLMDTWGYHVWNEIRLDLTVFGFTLGLAGLAGFGFGLLPALYSSRSAPHDTLRQAGRTATPGRAMRRFLDGLTVAEMGLALVLLIGAGIMLRNLASLQTVNPGFDSDHVLCAGVSLPWARYPEGTQRAQFYESALRNLQALPEVQDAALTNGVPMTGHNAVFYLQFEGRDMASYTNNGNEQYRYISDGYFRTLHIGLIKGRFFDQQDRADSTPVAIINQSMARRYFGNDDPVGTHMWIPDGVRNPRTIVGVVADERNIGLSKDPVPIVYILYRQSSTGLYQNQIHFLVRTNTDPMALAPVVRSQIANLDAQLALANVNSLEQLTLNSVLPQRVGAWLLGVFAAVTLTLSALGIYGVMTHAVNARTQEIGIRMAMGALPTGVIWLMIKRGLVLAGFGCVVGIVLALGLTRFLSFLLYNVNPLDPVAFAGASVFLVAVALLACWLPARRAAKVDPMEVLRWE